MNVFLIVVWTLVGLIFLIAIIGWCLPRYSKMERSIEIDTTPEVIFPYLEDLKMFVKHWSPWTAKDPNMVSTFNDVEKGEGMVYEWKGERKKVGSGKMTVLKSYPNDKVETTLVFDGQGEAEVNLRINRVNDTKVKVTWDFKSDNKNSPVARLFGLMIDSFLGPDFEKGLENLKNKLEN